MTCGHLLALRAVSQPTTRHIGVYSKVVLKIFIILNTKSGSHAIVRGLATQVAYKKQNHNGLPPRGSAATGARKAPGWTPSLLYNAEVAQNFNLFSHRKVVENY